jgi:hypothetical protein
LIISVCIFIHYRLHNSLISLASGEDVPRSQSDAQIASSPRPALTPIERSHNVRLIILLRFAIEFWAACSECPRIPWASTAYAACIWLLFAHFHPVWAFFSFSYCISIRH